LQIIDCTSYSTTRLNEDQ